MKKLLVIATAAALVMPFAASAETDSTSRIDQRQAKQEQRIDRGVQSGALTEREAARLEKGQTHVDNMENKALADGKVTARERARIENAQDRQSRRIHHQKHDRQHDLNHNGRVDRPARRR